MAKQIERKGWYQTGYDEGFAGQAERAPSNNYHARMSYRAGWADGDTDRRCKAAGYAVRGPNPLGLSEGAL